MVFCIGRYASLCYCCICVLSRHRFRRFKHCRCDFRRFLLHIFVVGLGLELLSFLELPFEFWLNISFHGWSVICQSAVDSLFFCRSDIEVENFLRNPASRDLFCRNPRRAKGSSRTCRILLLFRYPIVSMFNMYIVPHKPIPLSNQRFLSEDVLVFHPNISGISNVVVYHSHG